MVFRYRYLGRRGIFVEGKHYHAHDIVETDKRIEEMKVDSLMFTEVRGMKEKLKLQGQIGLLKEELNNLKIQSEKELKTLKNAIDVKLESLENKIKKKERIYKEVYEPKVKIVKEKNEKKKIKGGKIDGAN